MTQLCRSKKKRLSLMARHIMNRLPNLFHDQEIMRSHLHLSVPVELIGHACPISQSSSIFHYLGGPIPAISSPLSLVAQGKLNRAVSTLLQDWAGEASSPPPPTSQKMIPTRDARTRERSPWTRRSNCSRRFLSLGPPSSPFSARLCPTNQPSR